MIPLHVNGSKNSTPTSVPTKRKNLGMISEKPEFFGDEFTSLYKYTMMTQQKSL